ncbi:hypothetical protein EDD37DRAFT_67322 [Exophiala viscosa]|uniref:uncharacterized protein n=1 Tax=Exophiala viscosa TaxID=2486360 RepID=UPI00219CE6AF|nr:hypothetical protein EDD37DRAFT_67322 [Exophiala viscosa]
MCSGYRDPNQLMIRDESHATRQRASSGRTTLSVYTVEVPLRDRARAAFFSHYVVGLARTYSVLERIDQQSPLNKHLAVTIDAVSLAFFHFQNFSEDASKLAQREYLEALPLVSKALGSSEGVASDSTLLAVLLLDLFEKIMNNNPRSTESWMSHVKGALALFDFRQEQQLEDYVSFRLSVRLVTNMVISCVAADAPVPPGVIRLRRLMEPHMLEDPKWQVTGLCAQYANLRAAMLTGNLPRTEVLRRAKALDHDFKSLADNLPPAWVSERVFLQKPSEHVLERYYDVYPDYFTAQTCNVIRIMRISLNDTIRTTYMAMPSMDDKDSLNSHGAVFATQIIDTVASEICAAGPQFTGAESAHTRIDEFSPVRKLHCYTLLIPLYAAGMFASEKTNIRPWVLKQLRLIASTSGIRNAELVADMLERRDGTPLWSVYAILGSYAFAA